VLCKQTANMVSSSGVISLKTLKRLLWPPYVIGQPLYFHPVVSSFFLSSFFPRLISAVGDWMSTILAHMVWP